ncbi:LysR family transcriptional regulator [Sphingosinicellaceae bacterium]|nr:LysR family transcriptional regulator [Sphingosinicellaceae bacterium]
MSPRLSPLKLKVQFVCGDGFAIGPGKADLLAAIRDTGSISAAGRHLGYSYRRTWLMVDTMNRSWREPLVAKEHGGTRGGGASLTPFGADVLARYRALEQAVAAAATGPATSLLADLLAAPQAAHKS